MSQIPVEHDSGLTYSTPRWVKGLAAFILVLILLGFAATDFVITIVLVLLLGVMVVTGGHGPGRHSSSGSDSGEHTSPIEHGVPHP